MADPARPDARPDARMRLTLLGGFLGSGKTTWLRHQLHAGRFAGAHVIVNEAAETAVDDALLTRAASLEVLAGGCACCDARPALVARLRAFSDRRSRDGAAAPAELVLETSGLADPAAIVEAIRADPVLVHHVLVGETIVCVDAVHGLAQLLAEPLGRRQAEAADLLVLTKPDAADPAAAATLAATLRALNPGAALAAAVRGSAAEPPPDGTPHPLPALDGRASAPIFPTRLALGAGIDWTAFAVWLSALLHARGDDVLRVKGVVRTPAGRLLLQSVRKAVQSPEILPPQDEREDDTIVVIGRGYAPHDLHRSLSRFAASPA